MNNGSTTGKERGKIEANLIIETAKTRDQNIGFNACGAKVAGPVANSMFIANTSHPLKHEFRGAGERR
jgi:hypothetical protein